MEQSEGHARDELRGNVDHLVHLAALYYITADDEASMRANVEGTQTVLDALTPLLRQYQPTLLTTVTTGLQSLAAKLSAYHLPDGTWTPLQALSASQHEQLDASTSGLLEQLSSIPDLLELPVEPATADS